MATSRRLSSVLVLTFGALSGLAIGCIAGEEDPFATNKDCGPDNHSLEDAAAGKCVCEEGHTWCNENDTTDFRCCEMKIDQCSDPHSYEIAPGRCACTERFEWCNPSNPNDWSCCEKAGGTDTAGTGTDTGGTDTAGTTGTTTGMPDNKPPMDCTDANEGKWWCTNDQMTGPEGSELYECKGGRWILNVDYPGQECTAQGFAFPYGCVDRPKTCMTRSDCGGSLCDKGFCQGEGQVEILCGDGPGTACTVADDTCLDPDQIKFCLYGKLTVDSCTRICLEEGDAAGMTYDQGECSRDSGTAECLCCNQGEDCSAMGSGTDTSAGTM